MCLSGSKKTSLRGSPQGPEAKAMHWWERNQEEARPSLAALQGLWLKRAATSEGPDAAHPESPLRPTLWLFRAQSRIKAAEKRAGLQPHLDCQTGL